MWKRLAAVLLVSVGCLMLSGHEGEAKEDFIVCESTYALCTAATCQPEDGSSDTVSCACPVKTGYSAGSTDCTKKVETDKGTQISSRYYPVKQFAVCENDRPWAWCLDVPCIIDKDDPTMSSCACSVVKDKGPYGIVVDKYTDKTCTTKLWSSATIDQGNEITDFLKTSSKLKPFPLKILNPKKK